MDSGRKKRPPKAGSRFLSQVLADNIAASRDKCDLTQVSLAGQMQQLGYEWSRATVSDIERYVRNVAADELFALSLILQRSIPDLFDPTGIEGTDERGLDFGGPGQPMSLPPAVVNAFLRGKLNSLTFANGIITISGGTPAIPASQSMTGRDRQKNPIEREV